MIALFCVYQVCVRGVCCHKISILYQHSSSDTTAGAAFRALFAINSMSWWMFARLIRSRRSIEPRQQFHVQRNNQTHVHGRTSYQVQEACSSSKNSSSFFCGDSWRFLCSLGTALLHVIGKAVFPLFDMRRPRDIILTPIKLETLLGDEFT